MCDEDEAIGHDHPICRRWTTAEVACAIGDDGDEDEEHLYEIERYEAGEETGGC